MITLFLGRNIKQDEKGFYLSFSDKDIPHNKDIEKAHFKTYNQALKQMHFMSNNNHFWFNPHNDPTI